MPDVQPKFNALPAWMQEEVLDDLDEMVESPSVPLQLQDAAGAETLRVTLRVSGPTLYRVELRIVWDADIGVGNVVGFEVRRRERLIDD